MSDGIQPPDLMFQQEVVKKVIVHCLKAIIQSKSARHEETEWSIGVEFLLCESMCCGINVPCELHRLRGGGFRREARSTPNHGSRRSVWFIIHQQA